MDKYISQEQFAYGPLELSVSGTYKLSEDIVYNPLTYPKSISPYVIKISCSDVVLDLNNKCIKLSDSMYISDRNFTLIVIVPEVTNVTICNGQLGRVSKTSIYAKGIQNVLFNNLIIRDFEHIGIDLSESTSIQIKECSIGPVSIDVPVSSVWNVYTSLITSCQNILSGMKKTNWSWIKCDSIDPYLYSLIQDYWDKVPSHLSQDKFKRVSLPQSSLKIPDYVVSGICIKNACQLEITDTMVYDIFSDPQDQVAFIYNNNCVTDINGNLISHVSTDPYIVLQILISSWATINKDKEEYKPIHKYIKYANCPIELARWIIEYDKSCTRMEHLPKQVRILEDMRVSGIKLLNTKDVVLNNIKVDGVYNCSTSYSSTSNGVLFNSCNRVEGQHVTIDTLHSYNGDTIGINLEKSSKFNIQHVSLQNLKSGYMYDNENNIWYSLYMEEDDYYQRRYIDTTPNTFGILFHTVEDVENTEIRINPVEFKDLVSPNVSAEIIRIRS